MVLCVGVCSNLLHVIPVYYICICYLAGVCQRVCTRFMICCFIFIFQVFCYSLSADDKTSFHRKIQEESEHFTQLSKVCVQITTTHAWPYAVWLACKLYDFVWYWVGNAGFLNSLLYLKVVTHNKLYSCQELRLQQQLYMFVSPPHIDTW